MPDNRTQLKFLRIFVDKVAIYVMFLIVQRGHIDDKMTW
jgi:hypothetical protein